MDQMDEQTWTDGQEEFGGFVFPVDIFTAIEAVTVSTTK